MIPRLCVYFLGIYHENRLTGVVELGWGTQPLQTIHKIFPQHELVTSDYLEIGKMCFLPEMNHNQYFGSLALSALIKWLRVNTGCLFLYTLADGIEGKCGYVYQASNFYYLGSFKTSVYRDRETGEKIHPRSARILLEENARMDGVKKRHWLTHAFCEYKVTEFLETFFKLYPAATDKELSYYVAGNALKPVNTDYLYSELINPLFTMDGDKVRVSVSVKYLDQRTKAAQVSQFDLVLAEIDGNWKIVD